jgi:hypothetical protein
MHQGISTNITIDDRYRGSQAIQNDISNWSSAQIGEMPIRGLENVAIMAQDGEISTFD